MFDWPLLLAIFIAVGIGHWLGRRSYKNDDEDEGFPLEDHYIKGINYLLNEQPDEAIDTFVNALDVNPQTLETHLALGNLLRKRGEVGRAIKIHQNLLARPGLPPVHSQHVQLELAKDYIKSGLLDRAETLLEELVPNAEHSIRCASLEYLIEIYQDEKEWQNAIDTVNQLAGRRFGRMAEHWRHVQGHFFCEMAEKSLQVGELLQVRKHLKAALGVDRTSVRAHLLNATLEYRQGRIREAIRSLKEIISEEPDYISEALPLLLKIYQEQGRGESLKIYLQSVYAETPGTTLLIAIASLIYEQEGRIAALEYLSEQLSIKPSLRALEFLLELQAEQDANDESNKYLHYVVSVLQALKQGRAGYRCGKCGFSGNHLHWLCPSCKTWGSVTPVHGVEGE